MYIRWKKRARTRRHRPTGEYTLTAVRVNGKPRQRIVSYLGSIGSKYVATYWHQFDFWATVDQHLGALALPEPERQPLGDKRGSIHFERR